MVPPCVTPTRTPGRSTSAGVVTGRGQESELDQHQGRRPSEFLRARRCLVDDRDVDLPGFQCLINLRGPAEFDLLVGDVQPRRERIAELDRDTFDFARRGVANHRIWTAGINADA
jgi:hypothetical protein